MLKNNMKNNILIIRILGMIVENPVRRTDVQFYISCETKPLILILNLENPACIFIPFSELYDLNGISFNILEVKIFENLIVPKILK
jgi:hypothetical protein